MTQKTTQLQKRSEDEADPNIIIDALDTLGRGDEAEYQLEHVLAMASNWHLEYWLELPRDNWAAPEVYDTVQAAYTTRLEEAAPQATPESRAYALGERIKSFKRNLHLLAMEYVAIGVQLKELKDELSCGLGGARSEGSHAGWQALCQDCVGISYKTADRYIEDAESYRILKEASEKNPRMREYLELVESGDVRAAKALEAAENYQSAQRPEIEPSTWARLHEIIEPGYQQQWLVEMEEAALAGDELAAFNLARAASGEVPIARAYSGWKGGEATKGKTRRDPDPAKIVIKAAVSINRYWSKLQSLDIERRRVASDAFLALMADDTMPDEIARESYRILKERLGE